ncbi:MAG: Gfo/Idh/MocA family protein [Chloroflexota bacterium]
MIRIGIVGAGYWGSKHIRVFHDLETAELALVCDLDTARLKAVARSYGGVRTTTDYRELLGEDVDAVVIATSVDTHYTLAYQALMAGKHVLVEKPLTTEVSTAEELVDLARERGLVLMTGHTYQYHPVVDFLKDLLGKKELGDLYYIDTARLNLGAFRPDVDVLWDLAPHDISILLYLLGQDPLWVSAKATAHVNPAQHEISYVTLGFPNHVLAHVHVSWLDPCKVRRLTLVGSERMAMFDELAPEGQLRLYDKGAYMGAERQNGGYPEVHYRHGEVRVPFIPNKEPLTLECADFVKSIADGTSPRSNGSFALRVISILEAAHRSLASDGNQIYLAPAADRPNVLEPRRPQVSETFVKTPVLNGVANGHNGHSTTPLEKESL